MGLLVVLVPSGDDDSFAQPGKQPNVESDYLLHLAQAWPALPWTRLGQVCQEPVSLSYSEIRLVSSQPPISRNFVAEMATAQESKVIPGKEGPASHLVAPVGRKEEEEE